MIQNKPASILITDDESNIRLMVRASLESEGYEIREAADGKSALEAIVKSPPDLMVLDLNMPTLDGMAVLDAMKQLTLLKQPRVIILTAYGSVSSAVKAMRLGASDFIEKPMSPTDLRRVVFSVLQEPELDNVRTGAHLADEYEAVLNRIRKSLRLADYTTAQEMLTKASESRGKSTAEYFNLLGVLYETQRNWRLARKCYGKAIAADNKYAPARANMNRVAELKSSHTSPGSVRLGDEHDDVWYAALPPRQTSQHKGN